MDTTYGVPTNITAPPTAVNISSSTNASPIVVTTSAAHNLQTGFSVFIAGHTTNTAANGAWPAVIVLSSTTFSLTGSTGNGVGGATGTVTSLDLGGFQIPEDAVDDIDANSVNVGFEALGDRSAYLWLRTWLAMFAPPQRLTDADKTISAWEGPRVILPTPSGGNRTVTVQQATRAPFEGQPMEFWLSSPHATQYWEIKREGSAAVIVRISGSIGGNPEEGMARIHVEGGVWRLTGGIGITPGADA